jgi:hypothetical protein
MEGKKGQIWKSMESLDLLINKKQEPAQQLQNQGEVTILVSNFLEAKDATKVVDELDSFGEAFTT